MAGQLRNSDPELFRFITVRTAGSHLWMRPSKDINKIIGGVFARYAEIFEIEIYAYAFLSNHPHFLIRSPEGNTDEFMENVNREIARRVNWKNRRKGKFWAKRYADQSVISQEDVLEAFLYINTNPVHHGMVKHPSEWPGLCSYYQSISEKTLNFSFHHYSAQDGEPKSTNHKLKLKPLPQFENLSQRGRCAEISKLLEERTAMLVEMRKLNNQGFLGAEMVRQQDPESAPHKISNKPLPSCYSKSHELIKEFVKREKERKNAYAEASMRYRLGDSGAEFPLFTYKPPTHRKPRIFAFQPLPKDFFKKSA